jgi:zinc transport system ATP-binding protein
MSRFGINPPEAPAISPAAVEKVGMMLRGLSVGYGAVLILKDVTLTLREGDCWLLRGPNGSGKTTLLRTIAGLQPPLAGTITATPGLRMAYVPAETTLSTTLPLRLEEVVRMGGYQLEPRGIGYGRTLREREKRLLEECGLTVKRKQAFSRSSSGERQRALLARALMGGPHLLLMDEPTSNLDRESLEIFMRMLRILREEHQTGMLISTHAHDQFASLQPRIMDVRDGSLGAA